MRVSKVLGGVIAVLIAGLVLVLIWPARTKLRPPVLNLAGIEASGILDDRGVEMQLVTFNICNSNLVNKPGGHENTLFIKDSGKTAEAKIGKLWRGVQGGMIVGIVELAPSQQYETLLLVPSDAESFRIRLKYTDSSTALSLKRASESLVQRMPLSVRSRISHKFWRWVGFPGPKPSSNWWEVDVEVVLRPEASGRHPTPPEAQNGSH